MAIGYPPVIGISPEKGFPGRFPEVITQALPLTGHLSSLEHRLLVVIRLNGDALVKEKVTRTVDAPAEDQHIAGDRCSQCALNGGGGW